MFHKMKHMSLIYFFYLDHTGFFIFELGKKYWKDQYGIKTSESAALLSRLS